MALKRCLLLGGSLLGVVAGLNACEAPQEAATAPGGAGAPVAGGAGVSGASGSAGVAGSAGAAGSPDPCALWSGPEGDDLDTRLPDLPIQKMADEGEAPSSLHAFRAACERPGLLVVRVEPAWCKQCGKRADRVAPLLLPFPKEQIDVVTVLYAGPDNAHPTEADLRAWQQAHATLPGLLTRSSDGTASSLVRRAKVVPTIFLVDRRTLRISNVLGAPSDRFFVEQVASSLEEVGGAVVVPDFSEEKPDVDALFDEFEWELVQDMVAPLIPPPSPSNAYADRADAAALGALLFEDLELSGAAGISCATCHRKDKGFSDGLPTAKGVSVGSLNTPAIDTAAWNRWFFWDGRTDSLWSQALGPPENPVETAGSRLHVAHRIKSAYAAPYEAIFGALPPLEDSERFPANGKPGEAAFDAMTKDDQEAVTRVFVNMGKAIEAFERTLRPPKTRLEDYAAGNFEALTPLEREGLKGFLASGCVSCHSGPAMSDGAFHNILMPSSSPSGPGDRGRIDGIDKLLGSPFRADGPYSDDPKVGAILATLTKGDELLGQIKTPSLRGISRSGPWGHGGTFASLEDVMKHYGQAKVQDLMGPRTAGERDPAVAGFGGGHNKELVAFLLVLGGG